MKKRNVVVLVLIIALLLMGSAYAVWTDQVTVTVTANSATMNVVITDRVDSMTGVTQTHGRDLISTIGADPDYSAGVKTATETITNFIPYETVTLAYKIENLGNIDVELNGINCTAVAGTNNNTLAAKTDVAWSIQKYDSLGGTIGAAVTGTGKLDTIAPAIAANSLELAGGSGQYFILTLALSIDDATGVPYTSVQQTVFTFQPTFIQD